MTAVETLRSRAAFAASRGSFAYAAHLKRVANRGEEAAQAEIDETRELGRRIVEQSGFDDGDQSGSHSGYKHK